MRRTRTSEVDPTPSLDEVVADAERWITATWNPTTQVADWWRRLAHDRWTSPTLPLDAGGRGWTAVQAAAARDVFASRGVLGPPAGVGVSLVAPTIAALGNTDQIDRFVPGILAGSTAWCQLFSEPQAGSDLAGLETAAELDDERWVISGTKIWTSAADIADFGLLLARTSTVARHGGISAFVIDMNQPGVNVEPLRDMTGTSEFAAVSIDDASVSLADLIGTVGGGWAVARSALAIERSGYRRASGQLAQVHPGTRAGNLSMCSGDAVQQFTPNVTGIDATDVARLIRIAKDAQRADDLLNRQHLARLHTLVAIANWLEQRRDVTGAANLAKLLYSASFRTIRDAIAGVVGTGSTVISDGPDAAWTQHLTVFSPGPSIYGGTDEIQKNILAERVLGLPREQVAEQRQDA